MTAYLQSTAKDSAGNLLFGFSVSFYMRPAGQGSYALLGTEMTGPSGSANSPDLSLSTGSKYDFEASFAGGEGYDPEIAYLLDYHYTGAQKCSWWQGLINAIYSFFGAQKPYNCT